MPLAPQPSPQRDVARNVRSQRRALHLSQQKLAEEARISRRTLIAIESGDANVSLNTLSALAAVLGVPLEALVAREK
ncbi:MAG: helix-turn-helix transcriptional regulator [Pseudomonadota bacterium]